MKKYLLENQNQTLVFFFGKKAQVENTLQTYFLSNNIVYHPNTLTKATSQTQKLYYYFHDFQSQSTVKTPTVYRPQINSLQTQKSIKPTQLFFLLTDLELNQYNNFRALVEQIFRDQLSLVGQKLSLYFILVDKEEQVLKFMNKKAKHMEAEFQLYYNSLQHQANQQLQFQIIKKYMMFNFDFSREDVFQSTQSTQIRNFTQFFNFKGFPNEQRRQVQKLINNLNKLGQVPQQ